MTAGLTLSISPDDARALARVRGTVRTWLRSPPHRAVILTRSMNLVGVGMASGRFHGHRATIWVLQTGRR